MLQPGHILQGRYTVRDQLGRGGMGSVYRAYDDRLSLDVAVKEFTPPPGLRPEELPPLREQFRREATTLARLNHHGLVNVSDFFEEDGRAFLVMGLVQGENLAERIERDGPLPEITVIRLGAQLLEALDYCHQRQVLHRDIKPNNLILLPDGAPVLVDFGLVKLWNPANPTTHTLMRGMGTPHYASPEQYGFAAGHTDARSDIYSVAATLYYALTAQAPPVATDRMLRPELMAPLARVAPWLSPDVTAVVTQALELQPEARFASAAAMRAALLGTTTGGPRVVAGPLPATARVTTAMPAPAPVRPRFILPAALAGVALLAAVGFLAWRVLGGASGTGPTPPATAERGIVVALTQTTAAPTATAMAAAPTPVAATATPVPTATSAATATAVVATAVPTAVPVVPAGSNVAAARFVPSSIDGNLAEWAGQPVYDSPFLVYWDDGWDETNDGAVRWHLGWDEANLYIAARVSDDRHVQTQTGNKVYLGDSLEIQIDTDGGGMFDAPGGHRIAVAAQRTADGYAVEAAVPWSDLLAAPGGQAMAIALNLDDNDRDGQAVQEAMYSNAPGRLFLDPSTWLPFAVMP